MNTVITVENISKKYILSHRSHESYGSLRDVITEKFRSASRRILHPFNSSTVPLSHSSTREEFWALKDVSFEIKQGDRIGIIGRNGAGKSTLLKILSRITEPTAGKIRIKGRVASLLEVGTGFHPELTGRENIFLNGAILGMTKAEIAKKFDEIVAFSEIEKFLDTPVKRYSSGMYVRLAFAVAAHLEPEILIVDEVLAVGDAQFQKKCLGKMEEVGKEGRTVLFVSHNMGTISVLCDKCILMEKGRVKLYGNTSEVISAYNSIEDKQSIMKIETSMRNRGDGRISFLECSIMDTTEEQKNTFLIGEDIRLEIKLDSKFNGKMSFWLIIFDSSGRPLLSSHQRDIEKLIEINEGVYKLVYQTKNIGLMPGDYIVTAGAFDDKLQFLEWIDGCQSFEVLSCFLSGSAFDGRWGAVNQQAIWNLTCSI